MACCKSPNSIRSSERALRMEPASGWGFWLPSQREKRISDV